jgi:PAS domain S-box-containing protein
MSREDAFSSAIVTINEKGIIQSVDKNCCNLFGYTPEQLLNQDVVALIPPPYKEQHSSYLRNYHETGVAKIIGKSRVVEGLHSSGTIFPILLSISSVNVGDTKLYVAMIDKLEDKAGIITSNLEGTIVSCNQHCEAMFGYKVSELIGQNLKMLMPPPYSDLHDTYIKNYHATGRESVIGKVRNLVAKHKNGVVFPICLQVHRIKVGLIELFRGRIERLDTDIEAVFTLNDEGYIVSCNKTFVVPFFGYSDEELIGQHINKLFVSFYSKISAPEKAQPTKRRRVEGGGSQRSRDTIEWRIRDVRTAQVIHKDGSSFSVLVSVDKFTNGPGEVAQQYSIKIRRLPEGGSSDGIARSLQASSTSGSDSSSDIVGNWILGEKLGQGSYGRVKLATHKHSGLQARISFPHSHTHHFSFLTLFLSFHPSFLL